jgi:hypothetical protein
VVAFGIGVRSFSSPFLPNNSLFILPSSRINPSYPYSTIGDYFPERNLFQLLIALTSGPRFLLILFTLLAHRSSHPSSTLPAVVAATSVSRTLACGGWVFVTSSDHGDVHDVFMISFVLSSLPSSAVPNIHCHPATSYSTFPTWLSRPSSPLPLRPPSRLVDGSAAPFSPLSFPSCTGTCSTRFTESPEVCTASLRLSRLALQSRTDRSSPLLPIVPNGTAYSLYALFEWSLIVFDVAFDSLYILDFPSTASTPISTSSSPAFSLFIASTPPPSQPETPSTETNMLGSIGRTLVKLEMATSATRKFASETYLSFAFFTILVGLGPMIFYKRPVHLCLSSVVQIPLSK